MTYTLADSVQDNHMYMCILINYLVLCMLDICMPTYIDKNNGLFIMFILNDVKPTFLF